MNDLIQRLNSWIENSDNIVFFGGAGVSTESGIPDFRSADGLYNQKYTITDADASRTAPQKYDYPPETILSRTFFMENPEAFYKFYRDKMVLEGVKPNPAHYKLAELEQAGKLKAVVTQNIDGLHQLAGSKKVLELHGSVHRNYCMNCGARYGLDALKEAYAVPHCRCGGIIRPDVVLYEERLDDDVVNSAAHFIRNADILIVGGTSLVVYPAAGLTALYRGDKLVLINKSETSLNTRADLVITESIGKVLC